METKIEYPMRKTRSVEEGRNSSSKKSGKQNLKMSSYLSDNEEDDDIVISQKVTKRTVPSKIAELVVQPTDENDDSSESISLSLLRKQQQHQQQAPQQQEQQQPALSTQSIQDDVDSKVAVVKSDSPFSVSENGKWYKLPGGFRIPSLLHEKLYPYQRSGVAWMWSLNASSPMPAGSIGMDDAAEFSSDLKNDDDDEEEEEEEDNDDAEDESKQIAGGILADDMGLGKTLQVVSYIAGLFNSGFAECVLIVVPVSLVSVWENEFKKFAANIRVLTLHDIPMKQREKMVFSAIDEGGVVITTYGMVSSSAHIFGASITASSSSCDNEGSGDVEEAVDNDHAEKEHESVEDEDDSVEAILAKAKAKVAAVEGANKGKKGKVGANGKKTKKAATAQKTPLPVCWDLLVLDEGHRIKNSSTQVSIAINAVPSNGRILISGTPMQNNLGELYTLFSFVSKGTLFGDFREFSSRFSQPIVGSRSKDADSAARLEGARALRMLTRIISPFLLRRDKEKLLKTRAPDDAEKVDEGIEKVTASLGLLGLSSASQPATGVKNTGMGVMGLKKEIVLYAPLVPSQLELYKTVCSSDLTKEVLTETNSKFIFTVIMQLRKVASIPLLYTREDAAAEDDMKLWNVSGLPSAHDLIKQSGKLRLFVELMRLLAKEGRKVLVFSQYTRILDVLQLCMRSLADPTLIDNNNDSSDVPAIEIHPNFSALDKDGLGAGEDGYGIRMCRIDGSLKQAERAKTVKKFNEDTSVAACFLTTGVGSLGLTLTAATAVVIFDVCWNPAVDAQAVDRAYRMGQSRDVMTYRLISAGTVEEKMYRLQVFKNGLSTTVMGNKQALQQGQKKKKKDEEENEDDLFEGVVAPRLLSQNDMKDLLKLGPSEFSLTQRMVDSVLAPPPVPSAEIRRHMDQVTMLVNPSTCVGISHHDHLFRLAPEDARLLQTAILAEQQSAMEKEKFKRANTPRKGLATPKQTTSKKKQPTFTYNDDDVSSEDDVNESYVDDEVEEEEEEEGDTDEEKEENEENRKEEKKGDNIEPTQRHRLVSYRQTYIDSPESVGFVDSFSPGARTVSIHPETASFSAKRRSSRGLRFSLDNFDGAGQEDTPITSDFQHPQTTNTLMSDKEKALSKALDNLEMMERNGSTSMSSNDAIHLQVMKAAAELGLLMPSTAVDVKKDDEEEDDEGFVTGNEEEEAVDDDCEHGRGRSMSSP
jgi:SNF2 family DNA or RNA helicase